MRENGFSRKDNKARRRNFISRLKETLLCCCKPTTEPEEDDLAVSEADCGQDGPLCTPSHEGHDPTPDTPVSSHASPPSPLPRGTEGVNPQAPPTPPEAVPLSHPEAAPPSHPEAAPPSHPEAAPPSHPEAAPPSHPEAAPPSHPEDAPPSHPEAAPSSPPNVGHTVECVPAFIPEVLGSTSAHDISTEEGKPPATSTEVDNGYKTIEPDSSSPHMMGAEAVSHPPPRLQDDLTSGGKVVSSPLHLIPAHEVDQPSVDEDVTSASAEGWTTSGQPTPSSSSHITQEKEDRSVSPGDVELSLSQSLLSRPSNPHLILVKPVTHTQSEPSTAACSTDRVIKEECRLTASDSTVQVAVASRPRHWPVLASVRASFHQGSASIPRSPWRGNQCTTMALVAVTLSAVKPVNTWAKEDLDGILRDGDRNHGALLARLGRLGQTNQRVGIYEMMRCSCLSITLGDQCYAMAGVKDTEVIGMVSTTPMDEATMEAFQMVDLQTGLERALNGSDGAVVTIGDYSTAVIRDPWGGVRVWDSHCRGRDGLFRRNGRAVLLTLGSLDDVTPFVIKKLRSRKQTEAQYEVAGFRLVEK